MLFTYLDQLPNIPSNLLVDCYYTDKVGFKDGVYSRYNISEQLIDWLVKHVSPIKDRMGCQVMEANVAPHCDFRRWGLNYIISRGGNVVTRLHRIKNRDIYIGPRYSHPTIDDLETIMKLEIEPFRWHILNTHVLHSVANVTSVRKAITIGLMDEDPFINVNI
jgi:hypothetical protein